MNKNKIIKIIIIKTIKTKILIRKQIIQKILKRKNKIQIQLSIMRYFNILNMNNNLITSFIHLQNNIWNIIYSNSFIYHITHFYIIINNYYKIKNKCYLYILNTFKRKKIYLNS